MSLWYSYHTHLYESNSCHTYAYVLSPENLLNSLNKYFSNCFKRIIIASNPWIGYIKKPIKVYRRPDRCPMG